LCRGRECVGNYLRECVGKYLIVTGVAAVVTVLCVGWPVYDSVAQVDDAADDGTLTVGQCIDANASVDPVEEALIEEDVIKENLLSTRVTDRMCDDILERAPDDIPVQRLVTAQNYVQEIELIVDALGEAAGEAATKETDRHFLGDESLVLARASTEVSESAAQAQYRDETATAYDIVRESRAPIADRLRQAEASFLEEGHLRSAAAGAARCTVEQDLLNAISKELSQGNLIRVRPPDPTPKEVSYGETVTVKLSVSGNIRESYDKLERQIKEVDEASGEEDRCVDLTESMEAKLFSPRFSQQGNGLPIRRIKAIFI